MGVRNLHGLAKKNLQQKKTEADGNLFLRMNHLWGGKSLLASVRPARQSKGKLPLLEPPQKKSQH